MRWLWGMLFVAVAFGLLASKPLGQYKELSNIVLLQFGKAAQPQAYGQFISMYEYAGMRSLRTYLAWYMQRILTNAAAAKQIQFAKIYLCQLDAANAGCQIVALPNSKQCAMLVHNHPDYHNTIAVF